MTQEAIWNIMLNILDHQLDTGFRLSFFRVELVSVSNITETYGQIFMKFSERVGMAE